MHDIDFNWPAELRGSGMSVFGAVTLLAVAVVILLLILMIWRLVLDVLSVPDHLLLPNRRQ